MGLIIYSSQLNTKKYFLRSSAGAVEIWKGTFSPAGKKRLIIMAGVKAPDHIQPFYTQAEIYPLAFSYYIDKASALIHVPGMPDFAGIKSYLNQAMSFATSDEDRKLAQARINMLDRKVLFYKADVAASSFDIDGLQAAMGYLDQAAQLDPDEIEAELIERKRASLRHLMKNLKKE